jgi:uncharacterized membrane protein
MQDNSQSSPRTLWIAALVFCVVVVADSCFRWATFQYRTFDLAFYVQAFWLMLHGQSTTTILDVSLMGNHAEPICFLLLPLFSICRHPAFFVVVQTVLIGTMPFSAYRIARRMEFGGNGALLLAISTLVAPATGFMALHEFHPETLAAPLILLMLNARLAQQSVPYWIYFLLSAACKENVSLLLGWLCVVHCFLDRKRGRDWQLRFNVAPGAVALGWVAVYALWISPALNAGRVDYDELYGRLGGIAGMVRSPTGALAAAWSAMIRGNLVWGLFAPFLFLPLLRPRWVIISAPIFAQHLLSSRQSEWSIGFHYAAPILPLLWFGTAEACARIKRRDAIAGGVLAACVVFQIWIGPVQSILTTVRNASAARESARVREEFLSAIPENASIVAGLPYLSHLAMRERVHSLHHLIKGLKTLSRNSYEPPPVTDAVFVDAADSATFDAFAGYHHPAMITGDGRVFPESELLLDSFLAQAKWRSVSRNEATLFLRAESSRDGPVATGAGTPIDDHHRLVWAQFVTAPAGDTALMALSYELEPNRRFIPWMRLALRSGDGRTHFITKGPIAPGHSPGHVVTESWALRRPSSIPPGEYHAALLFFDAHDAAFQGEPRLEKSALDLGEIAIQ